MGGGGGFFAPIVNAVGSVVNAVSGAVGGGNIVETPQITEAKREAQEKARQEAERVRIENERIAAAKADSDARIQSDALSTAKDASMAQEGGTPTAGASQGAAQAKGAAGSAAALSQSQQAVNQSAGSGTLLTGPAGVDPNSLELGRRTLLGG